MIILSKIIITVAFLILVCAGVVHTFEYDQLPKFVSKTVVVLLSVALPVLVVSVLALVWVY